MNKQDAARLKYLVQKRKNTYNRHNTFAKVNSVFIVGPDDEKNKELAQAYYDEVTKADIEMQRIELNKLLKDISDVTIYFQEVLTPDNEEKKIKDFVLDKLRRINGSLDTNKIAIAEQIFERFGNPVNFDALSFTNKCKYRFLLIDLNITESEAIQYMNLYNDAKDCLERVNMDTSNVKASIDAFLQAEQLDSTNEFAMRLKDIFEEYGAIVPLHETMKLVEFFEQANLFTVIPEEDLSADLATQKILNSGLTTFSKYEYELAQSLYQEKYRNAILQCLTEHLVIPSIVDVNSQLLQPTNNLLKDKHYKPLVDNYFLEENEVKVAMGKHKGQNQKVKRMFLPLKHVVYFAKNPPYEPKLYTEIATHTIHDKTLNIENAVETLKKEIEYRPIRVKKSKKEVETEEALANDIETINVELDDLFDDGQLDDIIKEFSKDVNDEKISDNNFVDQDTIKWWVREEINKTGEFDGIVDL